MPSAFAAERDGLLQEGNRLEARAIALENADDVGGALPLVEDGRVWYGSTS